MPGSGSSWCRSRLLVGPAGDPVNPNHTTARRWQRRRPGPPRRRGATLSHKRAVAALAEHLRKQPAASGDAEPVRLALAAAQEEQQRTRNVPRLGVFKFVRSTRGAPSWSTWTSMTKAAAAPHEILVSLPLPKFVQFFHKLNPSPNPKPLSPKP